MGGSVIIETYGCTLNKADSRIMGAILKGQGFDVTYREAGELVDASTANAANDADYIIVNTCTVKRPTEQKILQRLKSLSDRGNRLIVAGCLATANTDLLQEVVPNASIVTTGNVHMISSVIERISEGKQARFAGFTHIDKLSYPIDNSSVIAVIPISEGCLSNCTFCETKFARGPLNSFSQELIVNAAKVAILHGAKEIELTSQDTGAYGADRKTNIAELVNAVSALDGEFMIRIGMLNPEHLHKYFDELIDALASRKVYKFLHLPVQSGSNRVLKDMNRHYSVEEFEGYVREIRKKLPGITIATDIIVGYPTESDDDFNETIAMLKRVRPYITNISKFGVRPHAPAAKLRQLTNATIKARGIEASRVVRAIQEEERAVHLGERLRVLVTERSSHSVSGRDSAYREIAINGDISGIQLGSFVDVEIASNSSACLIGRLSGSDYKSEV